jgi:hypothetical protein
MVEEEQGGKEEQGELTSVAFQTLTDRSLLAV